MHSTSVRVDGNRRLILRTPYLRIAPLKPPPHRRRTDPQPLTNTSKCPASRAKPDRFRNLLRRKTPLSHPHAMALEDDTHGPPVNQESISQLGEGDTVFVALDELPHLLLIKLP